MSTSTAADREEPISHRSERCWRSFLAESVLATVGMALVVAISSLAFRNVQESAMRTRSADNLRRIAAALQSYQNDEGRLPPAVVYDEEGHPLHSWRVLLLPYLREEQLHRRFRFREPWDSPHNKQLLAAMPEVYRSPRHEPTQEPYSTFYQLFDGPGGAFHSGVEERRQRPSAEWLQPFWLPQGPVVFESRSVTHLPGSFVDGVANTFLVVEAGEAVPWSKPQDLFFEPRKPLPKLGGLFDGDFHAAFADGSVRYIQRSKVSEMAIRLAINPDDTPPNSGWDGGSY